jgi:hypothetical protein
MVSITDHTLDQYRTSVQHQISYSGMLVNVQSEHKELSVHVENLLDHEATFSC